MYTVATVSTQVQQNFIAWSHPIKTAQTIDEARKIAQEETDKLYAELEARPDYGQGAVLGETIIIHDGETCL